MPVTTARQRVLTQISKLGPSSARELARTLRMSDANVRHHLRVLASDGRLIVLRARTEGRGRPEKVFGLSPALEGDNLAGLVDAILAEAGLSIKMETLAKCLLNADEFAGRPVARQLALLVEKLNVMHYQSRWEAGADGPRVLFGRCPYAAVIEKHPELCQMDVSLLGNALGKEVRQLGRIEKAQGVCVFAVR